MHINQLSSELLVMIFSKIGDFTEKTRLEHVCSHWRYQIVPLHWKTTKTCTKPLDDQETLSLVLNRCGEWLDELLLQNIAINEKIIKQVANKMKCLKHLKLFFCELDGPAVDSIADLFGQQLCSFIFNGTEYHPNMRRLIENESSKMEHLKIYLSHTIGTLTTKLPYSLKSFSFSSAHEIQSASSMLLSIVARDCKNLKILHFQTDTLLPNMNFSIGNIKSLVYLHLVFYSIENEIALQNVICNELPNLKALYIDGYCSQETLSNICRIRPDLVCLIVWAQHPFQISNSLNSLTLHAAKFLPDEMLFNQQNKSMQHLDIRSPVLPNPSSFIEKLLVQFPNLKSLHCQMPTINDDQLILFFLFIEQHLENGRDITIYFHNVDDLFSRYYKYCFPADLPKFKAGWRAKMSYFKCENFVLKKLIKEAIDGENEPSFMDDWWME